MSLFFGVHVNQELALKGELDNPFSNASRAERESKERARLKALQAEHDRQRAEEDARVAAKREEARLAKEALLAQTIKQKV